MTFNDWVASLPGVQRYSGGYGFAGDEGDARRPFSSEQLTQLQQTYKTLTTPDASGRLPFGTNIAGLREAQPFSAYNNMNRVRPGFVRSGEDLYGNGKLKAGGLTIDPAEYDPEFGYLHREDQYGKAAEIGAKQNYSFMNDVGFPMLAFGAMAAPAAIASFGGAAAGGTGATGLTEFGAPLASEAGFVPGSFELGASGYGGTAAAGLDAAALETGALGSLPNSYWNMLADAGGTASDAAPAGAGTVGDFGSSGLNEFGSMNGNALPSEMNFTPGSFPLGTSAGGASASAGLGGGSLLSTIGKGLSGLSSLGQLASGASGVANALGASRAAGQAAGAANNATQAQLGMFNTINQQQAPYREAGYSSLGSILGGFGLGPATGGVTSGQFAHQFSPEDLHTNLAPNYEFMRDQGLGAVRNQMNRTGGQYSGNTLKAINDYAMNFADNSYQNAFNNYNANQTNIFNRLSNIAGLGQTANANTGNAGTSLAQSAGNSMIAGGQAQAAGTIGVANALTNAGNNAMGWYALPSLLNQGG